MKRRVLIYGLSFFLIALAIGAVSLFFLFRATQSVPTFYEQALAAPLEQLADAGERFEKQVLDLRNESQRSGQWQVVFTDDQINGWLADELPKKFPHLLPPDAQQPRVAIDNDRLLIACQYTAKGTTTVVSLEAEPFLVEGGSHVAIRIRHLRAGSLPLPLGPWIEAATRAARQADISLRWQQDSGDPVAILEVPLAADGKSRVQLEALQLRAGEILIQGRTLEKASGPERAVD